MTSFDKVRISGYASLSAKRTKRTRRHIDEAKIEIAMFLLVVKPIVKTILRIVSIVIFILTVFAAYGGRFTPDFFTLPSILCLAAPYLAVTTLVISILWFIGCKWITGGPRNPFPL